MTGLTSHNLTNGLNQGSNRLTVISMCAHCVHTFLRLQIVLYFSYRQMVSKERVNDLSYCQSLPCVSAPFKLVSARVI